MNQEEQVPESTETPSSQSELTAKKLTVKETRYVEEYCTDFNASRAAVVAGYSAKYARIIGSQNLKKPHIKKAVKARLEELSMSAEEATKRLSDWGRGSIAPFAKTDPDQGLILDLGTDEAQVNLHLIKKLKQTKKVLVTKEVEYTTEIELYSAMDAVVHIAKIHGQVVTNVKHSGPIETELNNLTDDQLDDMIEMVLNKMANNG